MNQFPQRQRNLGDSTVFAVAGGGGGVGRSTLVAEFGRVLARRGRKVLVVDADLHNPTQEMRAGLATSPLPPGVASLPESLADWIVPGERSQPSVLSLAAVCAPPILEQGWEASALVERLRALSFDPILIDLPAAPHPLWSSVFVLSDVPVLVASMEPPAVLAATRALRGSLLYSVLLHPEARQHERSLISAMSGLGLDDDAATMTERFRAAGLSQMWSECRVRLEPYLVTNFTRDVAEREWGHVLALAWHYLTGVRPRFLGTVDADDRRWFHMRQDAVAAPLSSELGAGVQVEEIVASMHDLEAFDLANPRPRADGPLSPVQLIGLSPAADALAFRQGYRRLWEGLRRESAITQRLLPRGLRERILRDLEEANREVQTWLVERDRADAPPPEPQRPEVNPGDPIREAREAKGVTQRELSLRTKIDLRSLEAIEKFRIDELPRPVYLRAYLRDIGKVLGMPADSLIESYLSALSRARGEKILARTGGR